MSPHLTIDGEYVSEENGEDHRDPEYAMVRAGSDVALEINSLVIEPTQEFGSNYVAFANDYDNELSNAQPWETSGPTDRGLNEDEVPETYGWFCRHVDGVEIQNRLRKRNHD